MNVTLGADKMNGIYFLKTFEADTVVIQMEERSISTDVEEVFVEFNVIHSIRESLLSRMKNIGEDEYLKLLFYGDEKKIIELRVYKVDEQTRYSGLVNGIPVVIKSRGYKLKFSDEFYMAIEDCIKGELSL